MRNAYRQYIAVSAAALGLLLSACAGAPPKSATHKPELFRSHCQAEPTRSVSGIFRGLGTGENLQQAKHRAYRDIAEQLSVVVQSDSEARAHKRDSQVSTEWRERIDAFSSATLIDLQLDCLDNRDPSGLVHVALLYDARSLAIRYGEKIIEELGYRPRRLTVTGPESLVNSELVSDLRAFVESPRGDTETSTNARLDRGANGWQLEIARQLIPLSDQQLPYSINWPSLNRQHLEFFAESLRGQRLPMRVPNATEYRWRATPSAAGYFHLLGLYQNGQLDILRQDIAVRGGRTLTLPENGGVWETGLIAPGISTTDTYIALITSAPLAQTPLANQLHRNRLGGDGSLNRFLLTLEQLDAAVSVVNLAVQP